MLDALHLAFLANAWTAFSPLALLVGGSGIGLVVLALVGLSWLPGFLKRPLIFAGAALLVLSAVYQAGQAKGAHNAFAKDAARAFEAESARADAAERIKSQIAARATQDFARAQADSRKLKELNDALAKAPGRDRLCVDRALARRLRDL